MSVHLIVGRANAGKTQYVLEICRESLRHSGEPIVVVPSRPDVLRLADELARDGALGLSVLTFDDFVGGLWRESRDGRAIATSGQRALLLAESARRAGIEGAGIQRLAEKCIRNLTDAAPRDWRHKAPETAGAGAGLARILTGYADLLSELDLVEAGEAASIAPLSAPQDGPVVFHRFTDLSGAQEGLVRRLAASGRDVFVVLTWEDGFAPTESAQEMVTRFSEEGASLERVVADSQYETEPLLVALADHLFGSGPKLAGDETVVFSEAEGGEAEAGRIADEIQRLLAASVEPGNIAVVFRDPLRHLARLRGALAELGIEADFDVPVPFASTPFGRALLNLVTYVQTRDAEHLFAFLRSPYSGADPAMVAVKEARYRRAGPLSGQSLGSAVDGLGATCSAMLDGVCAPRTAGLGEEEVLAWGAVTDKMLVAAHGRAGRPLSGSGELDIRAHALANRILGDALSLGDVRPSLTELSAALSAGDVQVNEIERPGRVQVSGVSRMRARRFDAVIIGGLSAEEFPQAPPEQFAPGTAAAGVLEEFGGKLEDPSDHGRGERLFFYQVLTRARRRLVLSRQTADSDGEPVRPSVFLEAVADSFRPPPDETGETGPLAATVRRLSLSGAGPEEDRREAGRELLLEDLRTGESTSPRLRAARARGLPGRPEIRDESLLSQLAERADFSASEIETYLSCPYKWFWQRRVRADRPDFVYDAAEVGSFAHAVMEKLYALLREEGIKAVTPASYERACELVEPAFEAATASQGTAADMLQAADRRTAARWARAALVKDASILQGFEPRYTEFAFGARSDQPAVEMGDFELSGRIDRIDTDEAGTAICIDYKSGAVSAQAKWVERGLVQLPLYLTAVRELLAVEPVGGLYWSLKSQQVRGAVRETVPAEGLVGNDVLDEAGWDALLGDCVELATAAVAGMRDGAIPATPRTPDACRYCPATVVCTKAGGCDEPH